jgi:hypothetical protein
MYFLWFCVLPLIAFLIFATAFGITSPVKPGGAAAEEVLRKARVSDSAAVEELKEEEDTMIE